MLGGEDLTEQGRWKALESLLDYYIILGVPRYTDEAGIRRAYLRQAWHCHPDLHPDDPELASKMTDVNLAYSPLSDRARRARYDARRTTVILRPPPSSPVSGTTHSSPQHHYKHHHRRREHGIIETAFGFLAHLYRYVAATLPG